MKWYAAGEGPRQYPITNTYVFGSVFRKPELCKRLLEATLDVAIERVEFSELERVFETDPVAHGIRVDVYVKDGAGTVYSVEMQNGRYDELPRRSRYYLTMLDLDALDRGAEYAELGDAFVICFCASDPFGRGRRKYTFKMTCAEDGERLEDGTTSIFLNARGVLGEVGDDLDAFLHYLQGDATIENDFVRDVDAEVRHLNADPEWRRQLMNQQQLLMDERRHARAEGLAEGRAEGLADGRAEGMNMLAELAVVMKRDGREDELYQAVTDPNLRAELLAEYGINS